jgi:asparagine synthase (glutamine-hydrolysing)
VRRLAFAVDWRGGGRAEATVARLLQFGDHPDPPLLPIASGAAAAGGTGGRKCDLLDLVERQLLIVAEGRFDNVDPLGRHLNVRSGEPIGRLLAAAYLRWGDDLVAHIRGDYAFVIWDGARRRAIAARDPFGVRPLHYVELEGQLLIGSEVDQFLEARLVSPTPDDRRVVDFLLRSFRTQTSSFFKDILPVPSGHMLVGTVNGISMFDYRRPPSTAMQFSSSEACHEAFRETFFTAVRRRISSEPSVVVQLSGGVDSTSIFCAADSLVTARASGLASVAGAFAAFPGLDCDESSYVDATEKHVNLPIFRWDGTRANGVEFSQPLLSGPGNRVPWSSGTEGYVDIARACGAVAVIDGTGGDQVGMPLGMESDEPTLRDWKLAARHLLGPGRPMQRAWSILGWAVGATLPPEVREIYRKARGRLRRPPHPAWLASSVLRQADHEGGAALDSKFLSPAQKLRWETLTAAPLATSIDVKQHHASWSGLEMSFPFLDWDLVQLILAVPAQYWPRRRWLARLQREALRRDLPPSIYGRRSKAEFTPAMVNRIRRNLEIVSDLIQGSSWEAGRFVDQRAARQLLLQVQKTGSPGFVAAYHLWAIASVEAWLRRILGYRTSAA